MSATAVDIADALNVKLNLDQTAGSLWGALGGRIYQMEAGRSAQLPYMVWDIITDTLGRAFLGRDHELLVQFDIFGSKSAGTKALGEIARLLYDLLDGHSLAPDGFDRGLILFTSPFNPGVDEDVLRITCEATIKGTDF